MRVEDRWFQGREAEGAEDLGWGSEKEPERLVCVKMCTKGGGGVSSPCASLNLSVSTLQVVS